MLIHKHMMLAICPLHKQPVCEKATMYLKGQSLRLPGAELFRLGSPLQPVFDRETRRRGSAVEADRWRNLTLGDPTVPQPASGQTCHSLR
jgi:hypothetical protein